MARSAPDTYTDSLAAAKYLKNSSDALGYIAIRKRVILKRTTFLLNWYQSFGALIKLCTLNLYFWGKNWFIYVKESDREEKTEQASVPGTLPMASRIALGQQLHPGWPQRRTGPSRWASISAAFPSQALSREVEPAAYGMPALQAGASPIKPQNWPHSSRMVDLLRPNILLTFLHLNALTIYIYIT